MHPEPQQRSKTLREGLLDVDPIFDSFFWTFRRHLWVAARPADEVAGLDFEEVIPSPALAASNNSTRYETAAAVSGLHEKSSKYVRLKLQ